MLLVRCGLFSCTMTWPTNDDPAPYSEWSAVGIVSLYGTFLVQTQRWRQEPGVDEILALVLTFATSNEFTP